MEEEEIGGYVVPPEKAHLHESSEECPFPLSELRPAIKQEGSRTPEAEKREADKPRE